MKRAVGMLLSPNTEWLTVKNEPIYDHAEIVRDFALPIVFVSIFIMLSLIGVSKQGVLFAIAAFVLTFLNLTLTSGLLLQVSRRFDSSVDMVASTKLVVFSSIPFWLSLTFLSTHFLAFLAGLLGTGYSIVLAKVGLPTMFSPAKEEKNKLFGLSALAILFVNFITLSILIAIKRLVLPTD
ncbi:YIP1 family protein [Chloroherpeton thalassium]|uniref:YIP1 family protein n=1 Tax=Chloroherpeton thalassium TaxID=100716 RepID=UPI0012FA851E|nr:YIP1 family protein [Chloroherpeton thalassium]